MDYIIQLSSRVNLKELEKYSEDFNSFNLFGGTSIWLPNDFDENKDEILPKCKNKNLKFVAQLYCPLYFDEDVVHRFLYIFYCTECNKVKVNELSKLKKKEELIDKIYEEEEILNKKKAKEKCQIFDTNWSSDDESSNSDLEKDFEDKLLIQPTNNFLKIFHVKDWLEKTQRYLSVDEECIMNKLSIYEKKKEENEWIVDGKKNGEKFKDVDDESENDEYKFNFYTYMISNHDVIMRYISTNKCIFEYKTMEETYLKKNMRCVKCQNILQNELQLMQNLSVNYFDFIPKDISAYLSDNSYTFIVQSCKSYKHFHSENEWLISPLNVIRVKIPPK
ncbi:hypothetical protein SNEBB_005891 [Seison nebaliae]|nr:hypothetical protein SNEBB_005891 [Seison nebaliae]